MTTAQKIGIAVACLVGVAGIVAWDQTNLRRNDGSAPITTPVTLQTAMPPVLSPPVAQPTAKPTEPIVCPQDCAEKTPTPASVPIAATPGPEKVYTVVQGDSLYGISVKVFGTPRHYERIYEANRDRIKDPNTLQVGINLKMPDVAVAKPAPQ